MRFFNSSKVNIIVFSLYEKHFYSEKLNIPVERLKYIPYGDWNNRPEENHVESEIGNYYFSGGYSNRDYLSLIEVFNKSDKELVIVASKLNVELKNITVNSNIKVLTDIDSVQFDSLVKSAKACIFPFKHDSGASGQSVTLRCMRNKKLIISTDTQVIREYVEDKHTGIILKKIDVSLIPILDDIENNFSKYREISENSFLFYKDNFSYEVITNRLYDVLFPN
jgi:glycosyltransferase involved in cell wall biosynthesis